MEFDASIDDSSCSFLQPVMLQASSSHSFNHIFGWSETCSFTICDNWLFKSWTTGPGSEDVSLSVVRHSALFQQSFTPTLIIASSIRDTHDDHSITPLSDLFSIALRLGELTLRFGRCFPSQVSVFYQRLIAICESFSHQVSCSFSAVSMQLSKGYAPIEAYWESRHSFLVYKALHSLSY